MVVSPTVKISSSASMRSMPQTCQPADSERSRQSNNLNYPHKGSEDQRGS
jgi:hypothetical protein